MPTLDLSQIETIKGDRILIRRIEDRAAMSGSFYIPETHRNEDGYRGKKSWRGEVVKAGDKVDFSDFNKFGDKVRIGTSVILSPESVDCPGFKSVDAEGNEQSYIFVREEDLIGAFEPEN